MKTIKFNFKTAFHSKEKNLWLEKNHDKKISQATFILEMKKLKKFSLSKTPGKYYKPSRLKKEYQKFVERYGFFS